MPSFEYAAEIDATPEDLFWLTQDYDRRLDWDPFLKEARLVGGATQAGLGVRAWCVARNGMGMETEYVSFKPPHTVAVKMTRGPWPFASFAGSWRFKPIAPGRTRVIFRYNVTARPRFLGFIADPILRRIFAYEVDKRVKGLKRAVESSDVMSRVTRPV